MERLFDTIIDRTRSRFGRRAQWMIIGTIVVAGALLHRESRVAWAGAALLAAGPLVGYILSRTTGLPSA